MSEIIAENFGANATYVEGLLSRFRSDPSLVDEAWRAYFAELLGEDALAEAEAAGDGGQAQAAGGNGSAGAAWPVSSDDAPQAPAQPQAEAARPAPQAPAADTPAQAQTATPPQPSTQQTQAAKPAPAQAKGEAAPIRGGALKIVENMETSLGVPTATSNRRVPVKVLEENRLIVNQYLKQQARGKTSFTHFIAFAILRAMEKYPQMNDGFAVIDGVPSRVRRPEVNLGLAIDLEKKDGTRTLLVPNVKNAGAHNFAEFLAAYDDVVKRARAGKLGVPDFQDTTISLTNP
ncbi:MAG TPA: 2-oxo acid dehydrogenase subunit E2, partial [Pyrinomonadaceae bacterium]